MPNYAISNKLINQAIDRIEAKTNTPKKAMNYLKRIGHVADALPSDPQKAKAFLEKREALKKQAKQPRQKVVSIQTSRKSKKV